MSSTTLLRLASRTPSSCLFRSRISPPRPHAGLPATLICSSHSSNFTTSVRRTAEKDPMEDAAASGHHEESFEEFTARYELVKPWADLDAFVRIGFSNKNCWPEASGWVNWLTRVDRYEKEFDNVIDVFELQRNLNNAFAYDLVPSPSVITAALRAARRVNDFPTAVRIFEGIKAKVENKGQYDEYLRDLGPLREELGVDLVEDLYPEQLLTSGANTHG